MSVYVDEILDYLVSLNPSGKLSGEEGLIYGKHNRRAEGVLVAWMATVAAIEHAILENCHIILSHEALTFHNYFSHALSPEPWSADRARLSLLEKHALSVIRAHSTVDPTHIVPAFIKTVGLNEPIRSGHVWSFHEEPPISLQNLANRTATALNLDRLRVTGAPERTVTRVGTMVGGLMQDRHIDAWEKHLMDLGVEVIIGGETNDFAQRFAIDSGIALIETCHSTSEEPGLKILAQDFRTTFEGTKVVFHKEVIPWVTL